MTNMEPDSGTIGHTHKKHIMKDWRQKIRQKVCNITSTSLLTDTEIEVITVEIKGVPKSKVLFCIKKGYKQ